MDDLRNRIQYGVDAKLLTYDEDAVNICHTKIDIKELIEKHLIKHKTDTNCILINIEKDLTRYHDTIKEFEKISLNKFVHLKATYWKEKENLANDMSMVLEFLKKFHPAIRDNKIKIDDFSVINDDNIFIQDGPLACYCSHLRAMIYGYLNFQDYTIIVEDDISIANTESIEKYLKQIPDDWDIVFMNSAPKNVIYGKPFYKFTDHFHSGHFYIINNKCLPILFQNLYPIPDQVDVLVSNLIDRLNIYNIPDTVFQKNITTNTQNNLHVIFNSPGYFVTRNCINKMKELIQFLLDLMLPNNTNNTKMVSQLLYDVLFEYILSTQTQAIAGLDDYKTDGFKYAETPEYKTLETYIHNFIRSGKKGIKCELEAKRLLGVMTSIIMKFKDHDTVDPEFGGVLKAYSYGSTAQVYKLENEHFEHGVIIKKSNDKLRWAANGHNNSRDIFDKELKIYQRIPSDHVPKLISYDAIEKVLKMTYVGESLYYDFKLPDDWKGQIKTIFDDFTANGVYYPEFRLHNISVLNGKISFVDFGLAELDSGLSNDDNYDRFLNGLEVLNEKFSSEVSIDKRHQLYRTFMFNTGDNYNLNIINQ
jgi:GR25 family glycosyltransferase involved in LPS biosynthesis/tRNA A-37 threonylcarbamoyl transferase component Bud32